MSNVIKGILIDTKNKEVKDVTFSGKYYDIHSILGEEVTDIYYRENDESIQYHDFNQDEIEDESGVVFNGEYFVKGNVLIVGKVNDEIGDERNPNHFDCPYTIDEVKENVLFFNESELVIE